MAYVAGKPKCRKIGGKRSCTDSNPEKSISKSGNMPKTPANPPKGLGRL